MRAIQCQSHALSAAPNEGQPQEMKTLVDSPTEDRNPRTFELDTVPTLELVRLINAEDQLVADAVSAALPQIAQLIDLAAERVRVGGVVHYVGAGTSGRLATLDAAELPPTFGVEPDIVVAHMAGGKGALINAVENAEDSTVTNATQLNPGRDDVVIGLTASGRTPYVGSALALARQAGALTALMTSNPRGSLLDEAEIGIVCDTGPEALTGSTRMKSGTAQKLFLHTFSTGLMIRLGRTWSNLMVSLRATNEKLRARTLRILVEATGADPDTCAEALTAADDHLPTALVCLLGGHHPQAAAEALANTGGSVRLALDFLSNPNPNPTPNSPTATTHH